MDGSDIAASISTEDPAARLGGGIGGRVTVGPERHSDNGKSACWLHRSAFGQVNFLGQQSQRLDIGGASCVVSSKGIEALGLREG